MAIRSSSGASHPKARDDQPQPEYSAPGNGQPECIPFQLGDRTCWAVRACGSDALGGNGDASKPLGELGGRRISGWLRIADQNYVLVSETSAANSGADRVSADNEPWEMLSERETQIAVLVS